MKPRFFETRYFSGKVPAIKCAVCQRAVDRVTAERSADGRMLTVTIACHGSEERVEVETRIIDSMHEVRFGCAFEAEAGRLLQ